MQKVKKFISRINFTKFITIAFLIPPITGVLLFMLYILYEFNAFDTQREFFEFFWQGSEGRVQSMPIYLGLMSIASVLLFNNKNKKS